MCVRTCEDEPGRTLSDGRLAGVGGSSHVEGEADMEDRLAGQRDDDGCCNWRGRSGRAVCVSSSFC